MQPVKVTIESDMLCYCMPQPGDVVYQKLTFNQNGQVWFSKDVQPDLNAPPEKPHTIRSKIDSTTAQGLLKDIYNSITVHGQRRYATDIGSWKVTLNLSNGLTLGDEGTPGCEQRLTCVTDKLRKLLPELDIEAFGHSYDDDFIDIKVGTEVYNTTFGYGVIKYFIEDTVRISF